MYFKLYMIMSRLLCFANLTKRSRDTFEIAEHVPEVFFSSVDESRPSNIDKHLTNAIIV